MVYVGSRESSLYAVDALTGSTIWSFATGGSDVYAPAVSSDGKVVYIGSDVSFNLFAVDVVTGNSLYAVDAVNGSKIWSFTTDYTFFFQGSAAMVRWYTPGV